MKKVIQDSRGVPLGWMRTSQRRGSVVEVIDCAGFSYTGYVAEPLYCSERISEGVSDTGNPEDNELK